MLRGTDNAGRVLVLLSSGRDAELVGKVLTPAGFNCWVAPDWPTLCKELTEDAIGVLTAEEDLIGIIAPFREALAKQPPWSDLPVIVFTNAPDQIEARLDLQRALGPAGNVLLVDRPVRTSTLIGVLEVAKRARLRQFEARSQATRLEVLADASRLISSLDGEEVLQSLAQLVVPRLADWCAVDLLDGLSMRPAALAHASPEKAEQARERLRQGYPLDRAPAHGIFAVTRSGAPELLREVTDSSLEQVAASDLHASVLRELGMRSAVVVPLVSGGPPIGTLTLALKDPGSVYNEDDLQFAMELGRRAGAALEKVRLLQAERAVRIEARAASEQARRAEERVSGLAGEAERSRAQLEATFQAMTDGVVVVDMAGNVVLMNEAEAEIRGYESAAALKMDLARFARIFEIKDLEGKTLPVDRWPVSRVLRGETLIDCELSGLRRDTGQLWYLSFSGRPVRDERGRQNLALVITRDITSRKVAEDALRESERRFRFLADNVPQIVWTANPDGVIDYCNDRWYGFTGRKRVNGADESWIPLLHPADLKLSIETWERSVRTGEPYQIEHRLLDYRTGESRWFLARALPLRDQGNQIQKWFGTLTDIHDQKEAEGKLAEALHTREDFLAIAGHELKTPLTALLMHIQGLQSARRGKVSAAKFDERLEKAARAGDRLASLIDQMLDVSRITAGRLQLEHEQFDLDALIREVSDRFSEEAARAGSSIALDLQARVHGTWDRLRLEQVVTNLIGNAVKYGKGNPIDVVLTVDGAGAVIRVKDRGIGILPGQQEKIFERFERAVGPREFGGFGLGLWITRQIVEASGGAIAVESEPGVGSVFTVRLPLELGEGRNAIQ